MEISRIKASKVFAGPGAYALVAEAEVYDREKDEILFATVQSYDGEEYSIQGGSVYAFLAENGTEPVNEFIESYHTWKDAKESGYAGVFEKLRKVLKMLGECA